MATPQLVAIVRARRELARERRILRGNERFVAQQRRQLERQERYLMVREETLEFDGIRG